MRIVLAILTIASADSRAEETTLIAAASSLRSVWPALIEKYTEDTRNPAPRTSFASSGLLSTQVLNGAPFDVFLSADLDSINRLPESLLAHPAKIFATGNLQLVAPLGSPLAENLSMSSLAAQLNKPHSSGVFRLAIPNPTHAPYGRAAKSALIHAGLWPVPAQSLLTAENASQTLQFVKSGAVDAAIVPQALVKQLSSMLVSSPIEAGSYQQVEHVVAVLQNATPSAQEFAQWLLSDRPSQILLDAGLLPLAQKE